MTQLKGLQKTILEAIKRASADEPKRIFTRKDKEGKSLFAMLPYALLFNRRVTMMDIGVYAVILGHCIRSGAGSIRLSQREIADVLGTYQPQISGSVRILESLDWLEVERQPKATSTYCPKTTETFKAKRIRLSETKPRRRKRSRLQKEFLKQLTSAEEARKKFLNWFKSLSDKEAIKFYEEHSDFMDYITKEEKNLTTKK